MARPSFLVASPAAFGSDSQDEWKMDIDLRVPRRLWLSAETLVGDIDVMGIRGHIYAHVRVVRTVTEASAEGHVRRGPGSIRGQTQVGKVQLVTE